MSDSLSRPSPLVALSFQKAGLVHEGTKHGGSAQFLGLLICARDNAVCLEVRVRAEPECGKMS